jgi:hypothetical protein
MKSLNRLVAYVFSLNKYPSMDSSYSKNITKHDKAFSIIIHSTLEIQI